MNQARQELSLVKLFTKGVLGNERPMQGVDRLSEAGRVDGSVAGNAGTGPYAIPLAVSPGAVSPKTGRAASDRACSDLRHRRIENLACTGARHARYRPDALDEARRQIRR